jgi:hypothetical protein
VIDVHRDNPPFIGWVSRRAATLLRRADETVACGAPEPMYPTRSLTGRSDGAFVWDRVHGQINWRIASDIAGDRVGTLDISQLPMAVAGRPQPDYAFNRFDVDAVRWHAGGMQLMPGEIASVHFRHRVWDQAKREWNWEYPVGANGLIRLAPNTRVVAVDVIVVALEGDQCDRNIGSASRFTRADAEVWFDGREVDAQQTSVGLSDRQLSVSVLDRDPRPRWSEAVFNDAGGGRSENRLMQDPDNVFSQCGARFGLGVQFRLRRWRRVEFNRTEPCGEFADDGSNAASCMSWAALRAFGERDQLSPALRIFIVRQHLTLPAAVARAYHNDIVVGLRDLETTSQSNAQNLIAHELGHALNPYNPMFNDGYTDPADSLSNLMRDWANRLTRAQCEASYENARGFLYR